jgi:hypothetical protein
MGYFVWLIVGIILLAITIFVHKNTYEQGYRGKIGDKLPTPRWLYIVAIAIAATPILSVTAFAVGFIEYCLVLGGRDIVFHCESRWWKSLMGWLTKEV